MAADWLSKLPIDMINQISAHYGVEPTLIYAICNQESAGKVYAQRFEPHYLYLFEPILCAKAVGCSIETEQIAQQTSYGLMQVMGAVFREYGFKGWLGEAFKPEVNLEYGIKHFSRYLTRYKDPVSAIAAYNAGSPRMSKDDPSKFENEAYVQSVLRWKAQADGKTK